MTAILGTMYLWFWLLLSVTLPALAGAKPYYLFFDKETDSYGIFYRNSYGQKERTSWS